MSRGKQVKLYVEGGGDSDATRTELRKAFQSFLKRAGVEWLPRVVACGGRSATLEDFRTAIESRAEAERAFLLVDSEEEVIEGHSVWAHLEKRDAWKKPGAAPEDSAFLMVQCMEHWLIVDVKALESYCGPGFNAKQISAWPNLEAVPKKTVQAAIEAAMRGGKRYAKGQVSFEILAKVDPELVKAGCPGARQFLDAMCQL